MRVEGGCHHFDDVDLGGDAEVVEEGLEVLLHLERVVLHLGDGEDAELGVAPGAVLAEEEGEEHEHSPVVHHPPHVHRPPHLVLRRRERLNDTHSPNPTTQRSSTGQLAYEDVLGDEDGTVGGGGEADGVDEAGGADVVAAALVGDARPGPVRAAARPALPVVRPVQHDGVVAEGAQSRGLDPQQPSTRGGIWKGKKRGTRTCRRCRRWWSCRRGPRRIP